MELKTRTVWEALAVLEKAQGVVAADAGGDDVGVDVTSAASTTDVSSSAEQKTSNTDTSVDLSSSDDLAGVEQLAAALEQTGFFSVLDISCSQNNTLTSLDLSYNAVGSEGAERPERLATALSRTMMTSLAYSDSANELSAAVSRHSATGSNDDAERRVARLEFTCNDIGEDWTKQLAFALEQGRTDASPDTSCSSNVLWAERAVGRHVEALHLDGSCSGIGDHGTERLVAALEQNNTVTSLDHSDNDVEVDEVLELVELLRAV
eukprot:gnl/TRDRNA2_/TRDRNA2_59815_c0_seq1.p1 gnl/TRDRNA2_/TRDRNA2_59815_c0~~gnl/TRDRNA2_/TRDRNA2_59815_c0_seq1.p1  ORF type:complete len:264 (-),score=56.97 gnl/TRDRNA2_/TRDRNA2_59815_c0_seq1:64-855(-)